MQRFERICKLQRQISELPEELASEGGIDIHQSAADPKDDMESYLKVATSSGRLMDIWSPLVAWFEWKSIDYIFCNRNGRTIPVSCWWNRKKKIDAKSELVDIRRNGNTTVVSGIEAVRYAAKICDWFIIWGKKLYCNWLNRLSSIPRIRWVSAISRQIRFNLFHSRINLTFSFVCISSSRLYRWI